MRPALLRFVLAAVLLSPAAARAWLPEGHMATGAMAYDVLARRDKAALATVLRVMPAHPQWDRFAARLQGLDGAARDRRLFELMTTWADEARGGPFDHDDWHYSQTFASSFRHLVPFAFGGAEDAFRAQLAVARRGDAPAADRAVALCWVMHIIGDMHQPLHATVWISFRFPLSDAGGNWAWVRRREGAAPERLHFFWDAAGRDTGLSRASPDGFVAELEAALPFEAEPPVGDAVAAFDRWVAATRALSYEAVYERGAFRPGVSRGDAPVLSAEYVARTRTLGARQIGLAGNRMAGVLLGLR